MVVLKVVYGYNQYISQQIRSKKHNLWQILISYMFRHGVSSSGSLSDQRNTDQRVHLGMHRACHNDWNVKILKMIKLTGIKLQCRDIKITQWPFQVHVRGYLYSVCSMYTNTSRSFWSEEISFRRSVWITKLCMTLHRNNTNKRFLYGIHYTQGDNVYSVGKIYCIQTM